MNEETPTPSRRRGRPPKVVLAPIGEPESTLAPPQELESIVVPSVTPTPAPTVPSPLGIDNHDVDLREHPVMAAKHVESSGSDSKVRGASEVIPPLEAGKHTNPALPEQFQVQTGIPPQRPTQPERTPAPPHAEAIPAAPVSSPTWVPIQVNDVVQVNNPQNRLYGKLFTVSDIRNQRAHGYQLLAGGKHDYVTVNEDECWRIGPSKVRSRHGCSAKWLSENR